MHTRLAARSIPRPIRDGLACAGLLAAPALVGDRLLLRTEHRLYSIRRAH